MKKILLLLIIGLSFVSIGQEEYTIQGEVASFNDSTITIGEVHLFDENDSLLKVGLITDAQFSFAGMAPNKYSIFVYIEGYQELFYPFDLTEDKELKLKVKPIQDVEGVKVVYRRKLFEMENGNLKVNVENTILSKTPDVLDILSKIPKVQLSPDRESVSVIGKGTALLFIGNQNVDVAYLKTLSVDDIKTIEIINNPSSKYAAEGRVVILITLKLSRKEGYQVTISDTYQRKRGDNNFLGVNASFKRKKIELKANVNFNYLNPWERAANDLTIVGEGINTNFDAVSLTTKPVLTAGLGFFSQINENNDILISANGSLLEDNYLNTTNSTHLENAITDSIITENRNKEKRKSLNAIMNFNHSFKKNGNVFVGFQYGTFDQDGHSNISNNYNSTGMFDSQVRDQYYHVDVFSQRIDYDRLIKDKVTLELGGLYQMAYAKTDFNVLDLDLNEETGSKYKYDEINYAYYAQLSGMLKKMTWVAGIRAENTNIEGRYDGDQELTIDKDYTNFFPKANLNIPIDSTKALNLNYARSINRPNYSSSSQVSIYLNPYVLFSRNLNINPTITDEVSATFSLNNNALTARVYQSSNPVYSSFELDQTTNIITFSAVNYKRASGLNLDLYVPLNHKKWSSENVLSVTLNKVEDPNAVSNLVEPYLYYYTGHSLYLPKGFLFTAMVWGLTTQKEGVFVRNAIFNLGFALNKKFYDKIDCTIGMNDVFRQTNYFEDFTINNIVNKGKYYTDSQAIYISLKYSIGGFKNSNYRERDVDDTQNRVR
jgi:hypothetical protein